MTSFATVLDMGFYERFRWAEGQFEDRDYRGAARTLEALLEDLEREPEEAGHPLTDVRLLLARAYYHSAQLRRAEAELRIIVQRDPVEHYARLMLGRTLQRQARHDEAAPHLRIAAALAGDFPEE